MKSLIPELPAPKNSPICTGMGKQQHSVEAYNAAIVNGADYFTAFQFRGRFDRRKEDGLESIDAARETARAILSERPDRPVAIYAVKNGLTAHVETIGPGQ